MQIKWKRNQKYFSRILLKAKRFIIYAVLSQSVKLNFMIKNFEKWREVMVLEMVILLTMKILNVNHVIFFKY